MPKIESLYALLPDHGQQFLKSGGLSVVNQIGFDVIRRVIVDVLSGKNIRESTEFLTRKRLASLNFSLVKLIFNGIEKDPNFLTNIGKIASRILTEGGNSKQEKWLCNWALGLTNKGVQNILRDNTDGLDDYYKKYLDTNLEAASEAEDLFGDLEVNFELNDKSLELNWVELSLIFNIVGSSTLTIRGSEKSQYGKLFEKLILGSILSILNFDYQSSKDEKNLQGKFWLSRQGEKRESDATLFHNNGQGARFDIGFIGRGNPEISLDKVSRFQRHIEVGKRNWEITTIILVDRVGNNSDIKEQARAVNGHLIEMSNNNWPKKVAEILSDEIDYYHEIKDLEDDDIEEYLNQEVKKVPIKEILGMNEGNQDLFNSS